jgi:hypothetical protein
LLTSVQPGYLEANCGSVTLRILGVCRPLLVKGMIWDTKLPQTSALSRWASLVSHGLAVNPKFWYQALSRSQDASIKVRNVVQKLGQLFDIDMSGHDLSKSKLFHFAAGYLFHWQLVQDPVLRSAAWKALTLLHLAQENHHPEYVGEVDPIRLFVDRMALHLVRGGEKVDPWDIDKWIPLDLFRQWGEFKLKYSGLDLSGIQGERVLAFPVVSLSKPARTDPRIGYLVNLEDEGLAESIVSPDVPLNPLLAVDCLFFDPVAPSLRELNTGTAGLNLLIPIRVQGVSTDAVVDTGAQVTVVSTTLFSSLSVPDSLFESVLLKNAQKGSSMVGRVVKGLQLTLAGKTYCWDVVVADIADDVILGYDFMVAHKCLLDLAQNALVMGGVTVFGHTKLQNGSEFKVSRVVLEKRVVVPPHSLRVATAVLLSPAPVDFGIRPAQTLGGLLMPHIVVSGQARVTVCFLNSSDRFRTLKPNRYLGLAEEIDSSQPEVIDADSHSSKVNFVGLDSNPVGAVGDSSVSSVAPVSRVVSDDELLQIVDRIPAHVVGMYNECKPRLNQWECLQVAELLVRFSSVFAKHDLDIGNFVGVEHRIPTGDAKPIKERMRRTPLGFQEEEEKTLKSMLAAGVIRPSHSDWAFAPVLIRKKDGTVRYCIDFRKLNEVTIQKSAYPLPLIDECLDTLSGVKYMSTLDMAASYWQIDIAEEDRHKTAFLSRFGLFEHVKMGFGLTGAPSTFQSAINLVLQGLTWNEVLAYLDDVIVPGTSFEQGLDRLWKVLLRFEANNLKLKPRKCRLFCTETEFLGRLVTQDGIAVPDAKIETILHWKIPQSTKNVQSFLGFANYHREFIAGFAEIAECLYDLTRPDVKFLWNEEHQFAFERLQRSLVTAPVLAIPNATDSFILDTDASDHAIGGELVQVQDGRERTIGYASNVLTKEQRKYCTTRKELLAVVKFTRQFRHYLLGRRFTVRTDHNSLVWLTRFKSIEGQLALWLEELSQYDMNIVHRPGVKHLNADGLSRLEGDVPECNCYEAGKSLESLPCGGCLYCQKAHSQWDRFNDDVDDVVPLGVRVISLDNAADTQVSDDQDSDSQDSDSQEGDSLGKSLHKDERPPWFESYPSKSLRESQLQDTDLRPILDWLERGEDPSKADLYLSSRNTQLLWLHQSQLKLVDGVLYYHWVLSQGVSTKLVVPSGLKREVLQYVHDARTGGHPGQRNTLLKCRMSFYWPDMSRDCLLYVKSCSVCNQNKKPSRRQRAAMVNYHSGVPFDRVHLDILGPLTTSDTSSRYVLVMIDQFTKWIECVALGDQTAESVARTFVNDWVARLGVPTFVHTDRGSNFESSLFKEVCRLLEVVKTRTTPYRPAANGQVERANRTILHSIRCYLGKKKRCWDEYLPFVAMAMRATVNRNTGFTPNMMVLGRELTLPVDIVMGVRQANAVGTDPSVHVTNLVDRLSETHALARETIQGAQRYQKSTYDVRAKQTSFDRGDLVYKLNVAVRKGQSRKLEQIYVGPFLVTEVLSPILYRIEGRRKSMVAHHDRLRICEDRVVPIWMRRKRHDFLSLDETIAYDEAEQSTLVIEPSPAPADAQQVLVDPGQSQVTLDFAASQLLPPPLGSPAVIGSKESTPRPRSKLVFPTSPLGASSPSLAFPAGIPGLSAVRPADSPVVHDVPAGLPFDVVPVVEEEESGDAAPVVTTRAGRHVKRPARYED